MRRFCFFLLICFPYFLWSEASYSIVCVHIGDKLPSYIDLALTQARLFNENCPIVLIANERALKNFIPQSKVTLISCESLFKTPEHDFFLNRTNLNDQLQNGYWRYTSERFLYLHDYMVASGAKNVFHIENDVMLYVDLGDLLPLFKEHYQKIATTFESEFKCIPGFVFIPNKTVMQKLAHYFALKSSKKLTDMKLLALFWKEHPEDIDCLPMIMKSYILEHTPTSHENCFLKKKLRHCCHVEQFRSIFDGAAIGVFFDGLDPVKSHFLPGYLMKTLFNPSLINYTWEKDERGRLIPYAAYENESYRINNLHIASKRLERFSSQ